MTQRTAEELLSIFSRIFGGRRDRFALYYKNLGGDICVRRSCKACNRQVYGGSCMSCGGNRYLSFGAENLINHLNGKAAAGIYPVNEGGLCRFSVMTLKGENFAVRLKLISETCAEMGFYCLREITDFGAEARLWMVFGQDLSPEASAELSLRVLEKAAEKDLSVFEAADYILPVPVKNSDKSVLLPLYNITSGYSFFLDENMKPIQFPLDYLEKLSPTLPIIKEETPEKADVIKAELCGRLYIPLSELSGKVSAGFCRQATFINPDYSGEFSEASPIVRCWEIYGGRLLLPPKTDLSDFSRKVKISDIRCSGAKLKLKMQLRLNPWQEIVKNRLLENGGGVVAAPVGSGKTEAVCAAVSKLSRNTLILVPDRASAIRWRKRLCGIFGIDQRAVGLVAEDSDFPNGVVDVAVMHKNTELRLAEYISFYGTAVVADCDRIRCGGAVFRSLMEGLCPSFVCGLSSVDIENVRLREYVRLYVGKQIN